MRTFWKYFVDKNREKEMKEAMAGAVGDNLREDMRVVFNTQMKRH